MLMYQEKRRHALMRCQVNLSDNMVSKVDAYAKDMGVSRSALCSILIGQGIMSFEKANSVVESMKPELLDVVKNIATK